MIPISEPRLICVHFGFARVLQNGQTIQIEGCLRADVFHSVLPVEPKDRPEAVGVRFDKVTELSFDKRPAGCIYFQL